MTSLVRCGSRSRAMRPILNWPLGAVPPQRAQLGPASDDGGFAGGQESLQSPHVVSAIARRNDQLRQLSPDGLVRRPPEELLGPRVPRNPPSLLVHHDHRIEGG